jgi:peptide/nickel transport system substrate-binding protein
VNRAGLVARTIASLVLVATISLGGCASRGNSQKDPNTLIGLVRTDGATMNPMFAQTVEDALVYSQLLYESLSYIGDDYLPHPRLATSWTHSPDGKHWDILLRHDVRWSDGVPFTSKDVVYTYDATLDPKTAALGQADLAYIKSVKAVGPYRVTFDLGHPSAVFTLNALSVDILPEHVLASTPNERLRFTGFGEKPVGTGPYMLERWVHDSDTEFVRNPYAWRRPHIERIDIRTIFNDQSELEAIANGSADMIDDLSSIQYRQLQRIAPNVQLSTFPSVYLDVILPNQLRPGLRDVAVRRAMMYGQDRQAIVDGFFLGKVAVPDGLIPPGLAHWHNPNVTQYTYNPAKARAVLDAAGWHPGPDGVRRHGNTKLSFELMLNQGSATYTDMMLSFVADMQAIGIDIQLRQLDFPSMVSREFAGKFDLVAEGFGGSVDPDMSPVLMSNQVPPTGGNTTHFNDPAMDKLLQRGLVELNDSKRRVIYDEMQRMIANEIPIFYQYGRFAALAHATRLHLDPKTTLQSPLLYYNVEDWTLAK